MREWRRIVAWIAGLALVIALFPTFRAIVNGSSSQPSVSTTVPSPASVRSTEKSALYAATIAARTAPVGSRRVLLVGNSVAFDLGPGFRDLIVQPPVASVDIAIPACNFPPLVTATYRNPLTNQQVVLTPCHPPSEAIYVRTFRPDIVFWIANDAPQPWFYRGRELQPCAEPYDSLYERSLRDEIARLGASGATVVVTTEAFVRYVVAGDGLGASALPDNAVECNNALRRAVAAQTGAQVADLFGYTCPAGKCLVKQDGVTLRPDGLHYQGPGADIVAKWLINQVKKKT